MRFLVVRFGQGGKRSVGFVQRVIDAVEGKIPRRAQGFDQVGDVEFVAFELVIVDSVFVDDDAGLPRNKRFERLDFKVEQGDDLMQYENGDDGDDPVEQGNGGVGHGNTHELGDQQGDNEFEGLHFPDLPLAHQSHDEKEHDEDDRRADHNEYHIKSFCGNPESM